MNELEDSHCEVRKVVNFQYCDFESSQLGNDGSPSSGSPSSRDSSASHCSENTLGGFFDDCNYAWLSCQSRLIVFNTKTGACLSTWTFHDKITCITQFPSLPGQIPLLLIGLDNGATRVKESQGTLCIFDCTKSQTLRAIRVPAGVEKACVINGGTDWEDTTYKLTEDYPIDNSGILCTAVRNLNHFMIDLQRDTWDSNESSTINDETNPLFIHIVNNENASRKSRESVRKKPKHSAFNLVNKRFDEFIGFNRDEFESSAISNDKLTTAMIYSRKIGCIISGVLGRIVVWQNSGVVRWISSTIDDNMSISHLAILEPTDDPRPFCYLWVNYQDDYSLSMPSQSPILKMYSILFERKYTEKGINYYFNIEGEPSLKFQLQLYEGCKITNLNSIIKDNNSDQYENSYKRGEESLLLIGTDDVTYLFDLNQWYKEQMPRKINECDNINAIFSSYQTKINNDNNLNNDYCIINSSYVPDSLREFSKTGQDSPEEFSFPNSLAFQWIELQNNRVIIWMTRGLQLQRLREISLSGPIVILQPTETYHNCLAAGLISYDPTSNNNIDSQREKILTLCLEQRWTTFLLKCINEWSDGSAAYLYPAFLRWGMQRASTIRLTAHRLCIPLFDHSGIGIDESDVKLLRSFSQQMECLSNVVDCLPADDENYEQQQYQKDQQRVLRRVSMYLDVLLWFYDVGLLPETNEIDEDEEQQQQQGLSFLNKIPYPVERLTAMYREKRLEYERTKNNDDTKDENLFIDELITRECSALILQWEKDNCDAVSESSGYYPPPSLQSLLRSCLTDCYHPDTNEAENKHQIIIYLLMDLVMLLQASFPSVDQLIKYPAAFKLSPSLIKLTQAFWLLDHEDYQGFLDIITGQLVSDSDVKDWHHHLIIKTLIKKSQGKLALIYLRVRRPPLSSIDDQGVQVSLSVGHGSLQSAFHHQSSSHDNKLLIKFFRACRDNGCLNHILLLSLDPFQEAAFVKFLEEEKYDETRLFYYLQRCRYTEATGVNSTGLQNKNKSSSLMMYNAYNATLPEVTRKFSSLSSSAKQNINSDGKKTHALLYPMSHCQSRVNKREIYNTVIQKAREINNHNDKMRIPFISAPCSSLRLLKNRKEKNSILFLAPEKKKRKLDDMRDDNADDFDTNIAKKRRIMEDDHETSLFKKKQLDLAFDTPIIKRKNQSTGFKSQPIETPHSILKIRQMIKDSSPSSDGGAGLQREEEKTKKPRQIRFSINQVTNISSDNSSVSDSSIISLDNCQDNGEKDDDDDEDDDDELSPEKREDKVDKSELNNDVSLNTTGKSLCQSTILSDNSNIELSGPRPRPKLRRSSTTSLLRRSLNQNFLLKLQESARLDDTMGDISLITNDIATSSPKKGDDTSIYDSTVLSSGSSFEFSPEVDGNNKSSFSLQPMKLFGSNSMDDQGEKREADCRVEAGEDEEENQLEAGENENQEEFEITEDGDEEECQMEDNEDKEECQLDKTMDIEELELDESQEIEECNLDDTQDINECNFDEDQEENQSEVSQKYGEATQSLDNCDESPIIASQETEISNSSQQEVHEDSSDEMNSKISDDEEDEYSSPSVSLEIRPNSSPEYPIEITETSNEVTETSNEITESSVEISEIPVEVSATLAENPESSTEDSETPAENPETPIEEPEIPTENSETPIENPDISSEIPETPSEISQLQIPTDENYDNEDEEEEENNPSMYPDFYETDEMTNANNNAVVNLSSDSENEALVFTFEEDEPADNDDEVFKSLTNSMDVVNTPAATPSLANNTQEIFTGLEKKSATSLFYEAFNITDDDSLDRPDSEQTAATANEVVSMETEIVPMETVPEYFVESDHANITDDDIVILNTSKTTNDENTTTNTDENTKTNDENIETNDENTEVNTDENAETNTDENTEENPENEPVNTETSVAQEQPNEVQQSKENTEESTNSRCIPRRRRASSVAAPTLEPVIESPNPENEKIINRTKRATSLVAETIPSTTSNIITSDTDKVTKNKRGRPRKLSTSKETSTSSISMDESSSDLPDTSVKRRTTRATSVQKELPEITEIVDQNDVEILSTRKTRRASVSKETEDEEKKPTRKRQTRATSVTKESNDVDMEIIEIKSTRTRGASVSKDPQDDTKDPIKPRKTRASSVSNDEKVENTRARRKRGSSLSQELNETNDESIITTRRTRGASVSKDLNETNDESIVTTRRTRGASVSKDLNDESILAPRRTRGTSVSKELNDTLDESIITTRKTRGSSVSKDEIKSEAPAQTRKRAGSVSKKKDDSNDTGRKTRGTSLSKEIPDSTVDEEPNKRVTRGRLKRASSLLNEVIVEEVSQEDGGECSSRIGGTLIHSIPEEDGQDESSIVSTRGGGRRKRAASVDSSQNSLTRKTRGKNSIQEITVEDDDCCDSNSKIEKKNVRRKRAMSETKEIKCQIDRPRRNRKVSQQVDDDGDDDVFVFSPPDVTKKSHNETTGK